MNDIPAKARTARILIVEDSEVQALQLRSVLESNGYEVDRAASAEAAMEMLNGPVPDLIVADFQLPNMNGRELTRQLRMNERTRAVPVLIMTADRRIGERAGLESGADAYIEKSRDSQPLLLRINALLRGQRQSRPQTDIQFRRASVHLVVSSKTQRLHLQELLSREGYDISVSSDPEEILSQPATMTSDCFIVNLLDTKFDGLDACRRLALLRDDLTAASDGRPPFVVMGVGEGKSGGQGTMKEAYAAGCDDVVPSTSDVDLLWLRLRALVRRHLTREATQRLDAERNSAREALEQFRMLVQGVTDYALYMLDPKGLVSTWNAGAERIKGYRGEEIIGRHFSEFYTAEDRDAGEPSRALEKARKDGRYETEAQRVRKDGTRFWAHVVIDPIYSTDGALTGYAKVTRDITERRAAADELQAARDALAHAQKMEAIGQLTGGIAHDFNNMLAGIIGAMSLVRRRISAQRYDEAEKFIDAALTSANRAAALTSRLLAFGRRQTLNIEPVEVNAFIESARILLDRTMGKSIRIETLSETGAADTGSSGVGELWASTDSSQLESAILNLAINARDAMPEGGVLTIETRREAGGPTATDGRVAITVRDTGMGISPDVLAKVFDPFFTTKPVGQGTGLGLSMVYGFVSQSGGEVRIDSAVGVGTEITLFLPTAQRSAPDDRPAVAATQKSSAGETVLVVEDDPQVRMLILEILRDLKYRAVEASDPEQALKALEQHEHIDLMVSDVGLPGMNGRQLAEIARQSRPDLKVLFITGYAAQVAVRNDMLEEGMDMMVKPFALEDLTEKIRAMVVKSDANQSASTMTSESTATSED
ncbi:MAG: response regulator [Hyphomonadaceae bacterium]